MSLLSVTKEWAAQNQTLVQIDAFAKSLAPWQIILLTAGGTYVASNWASLKLIDWKSVAFGFALNIVEVIPGASGIVEQEKAKIVDEMQVGMIYSCYFPCYVVSCSDFGENINRRRISLLIYACIYGAYIGRV